MSQKSAADLATISLVIKPNDTGKQTMKSPLQKRRMESVSASATNSKQRRICNQENYNSPLKHLGKANVRNTCDTSLDDSVIVLEELNTSPASSIGKKKRPGSPDDSVIILSDSEGESRTETNVKTETIPEKVQSNSQVSTSKLCSNTNVTELQPISIDSEDENTIPNDDDSSISNSYVEIILVDNSPGIGTDRNLSSSSSTIFKPGIDKIAKSTKTDSPFTELASQPVSYANFYAKGIQAAAEQLMTFSSRKKNIKLKEPSFRIDTEGDLSYLRYVQHKCKQLEETRDEQKDVQNPNWASFAANMLAQGSVVTKLTESELNKTGSNYIKENNVSSESTILKIPTVRRVPKKQPRVNKIGSYYTTEASTKEPGSLREIVIDGCNVAMAHTNGRYFSEAGLKMVIDYFQLRGHTVRVFIPQHQRTMGRQFLEHLYTKGIAAFTPSRKIGGKKIISYDDRYILDYATMCDGIVVSMDQYRDLYKEKQQWKNIIENRLLVPTFVGNCVMFPEDPLGRSGPTLEQFLRH